MSSRARTPRPTAVDVNWNILLRFNPPPGYANAYIKRKKRPEDQDLGFKNNAKYADSNADDSSKESGADDKVVTILQNILRNLEKDIEQDRRFLKEERRRRQKERRIRREIRITSGMTSGQDINGGHRHRFAMASASPMGKQPVKFISPVRSDSFSQIGSNLLQKGGVGGIRKHDSFNCFTTSSRPIGSGNDGVVLEVRAGSLDRKLPKRTSSYAGSLARSDWSRYSRDHDNTTDTESETTGNDVTKTNEVNGENIEPVDPVGSDQSDTDLLSSQTASGTFVESENSSRQDADLKKAQFEEGFNSLPNLLKESSECTEGTDNRTTKGSRSLKRNHLKKKMRSFEILPNLRKSLLDTLSHSSFDHSDDTLSETSSVQTFEIEDESLSLSEYPLSQNVEVKREGGHSESPRSRSAKWASRNCQPVFTVGQPDAEFNMKHSSSYDKLEEAQSKPQTNTRGQSPRQAIRAANFSKFKRQSSEPTLKITLGDSLKDPLDSSADSETLQGRSDQNHSSNKMARFRTRDNQSRETVNANTPRDADRPLSAGTSGYSTDEYSCKTTDSEDDVIARDPNAEERLQRRKLDKYFLVLKRRSSMALKVDNSNIQNGNHVGENCPSFLQHVSMSDLAIPDHMGQLTDQSENKKVWGVILDMLFCVFDDQLAEKPRDVIILPGCNIRPLVYKSAINGVKTHSQTVSGISKFQFVIDDSSSSRKHIFGVESQNDLDTWYKVLKKASALDPEITNDITTSNGQEPMTLSPRRLSFDDGIPLPKAGYIPSQDSPNRQQKLNSPRGEQKLDLNGNPDDSSLSGSPSRVNGYNQASPRGTPNLMRNDSRRQSIQDFKKRLRREQTEPELSKHQPIRAMHFEPKSSEGPPQESFGKKNKAFGSFENLLKFKRKKRKSQSEESISNDSESMMSTSSIEQDFSSVSRSIDIGASESKLGKKKSKQMSRSLEFGQPKNGVSNGIIRRASDIKDKVFNRRPSKPFARLGDLHDCSMTGFLHNKHHLKWHRLWCVVCRGCFYGFKSQSADDNAHVAVLLANCAVVYVAEKDKRQKHLYIFKLSQEKTKSIYLCTSDYTGLMKWLTVLQMESNSVISNSEKIRRPSVGEDESICSSQSSHSGSLLTTSSAASSGNADSGENSRSRSRKKKKAPPKPPRHSSCPPPVSRASGSSAAEDTLTSGSVSSASTDNNLYGSSEDLPRYDKALTHVWQNDRGYLFNAIRAKLSAYRKRSPSETIYNKDLPGTGNEGLLVVQDGADQKGREVRRSRSFNTHAVTMPTEGERHMTSTPTESPTYMRKRHKPLVVKKISASDLEENQTMAGYLERKGASVQWIKYWNVLHEGTLFCFLTSDDNITVDVLNLHGYSVESMVDKFRGKRFVLQLSHENFTSLYLSLESREDMEHWQECMTEAVKRPNSHAKEAPDMTQGACADCENNRNHDDMGEKRKQVKQKLLEEMLRQKYELERKQAERLKKQQIRNGLDSPERSTANDFLSDDQRTSNVTHLRQRRMSTQLKVESIQKQIEKPGGNKRGLFNFGKSKKLDENKNVFLQDQLKELNEKLHKIDTNLSQAENDKHNVETVDVNQNRKSMPVMTSGMMSQLLMSERGNDSEDDENGRSKTIKSAVQKWTNKTFHKTSGKKKSTDTTPGKLPMTNGHAPEILPKQNGVVDLNGSLENGIDSDLDNTDGFLESSVTDLTRPLADLKLELNLPLNPHAHQNGHHSGSASPSSVRYNRSTSRTSTLSSLSSPRREIDPSVLAEIDAFEELTKQVLGARSKDVPAK